VLANKDAYGIRVANFSVGASSVGVADPINKAVEKLWLAGVTVVASSGNYAVNGTQSDVKYAPANDPFVITVGATDTASTLTTTDDFMAPWSAWGYTRDGFRKPDVVAPGRTLVGAVPETSDLMLTDPLRKIVAGYMKLSGTSFSAAIVSGAAAQILGKHPEYGPDQVKGALMVTARRPPLAGAAAGFGEIDVRAATTYASPPNPNAALRGFVSNGTFDDVAWYKTASSNVAWDENTWSEMGWSEMGWSESTWYENTWSESTWYETTWSETTWNENTWSEGALDSDEALAFPEGADIPAQVDETP
jgi:serine protease AprX